MLQGQGLLQTQEGKEDAGSTFKGEAGEKRALLAQYKQERLAIHGRACGLILQCAVYFSSEHEGQSWLITCFLPEEKAEAPPTTGQCLEFNEPITFMYLFELN